MSCVIPWFAAAASRFVEDEYFSFSRNKVPKSVSLVAIKSRLLIIPIFCSS